jgi:hypothetical protein
MDAARAVLFLEFLKPVLQACAIILTFSVGLFAFSRPRTAGLLLLSVVCFVTVVTDSIYLSGSLQTEWKITLFPVQIRRVLFLIAELLFIAEVFLWPIALFLLTLPGTLFVRLLTRFGAARWFHDPVGFLLEMFGSALVWGCVFALICPRIRARRREPSNPYVRCQVLRARV